MRQPQPALQLIKTTQNRRRKSFGKRMTNQNSKRILENSNRAKISLDHGELRDGQSIHFLGNIGLWRPPDGQMKFLFVLVNQCILPSRVSQEHMQTCPSKFMSKFLIKRPQEKVYFSREKKSQQNYFDDSFVLTNNLIIRECELWSIDNLSCCLGVSYP